MQITSHNGEIWQRNLFGRDQPNWLLKVKDDCSEAEKWLEQLKQPADRDKNISI